MAKGIKTGGREAGTPNKMTKEIKAILKDFVLNELDGLENHLEALNPKERLEILIKILPYVIPKVEAKNYQEIPKVEIKNIWEGISFED